MEIITGIPELDVPEPPLEPDDDDTIPLLLLPLLLEVLLEVVVVSPCTQLPSWQANPARQSLLVLHLDCGQKGRNPLLHPNNAVHTPKTTTARVQLMASPTPSPPQHPRSPTPPPTPAAPPQPHPAR